MVTKLQAGRARNFGSSLGRGKKLPSPKRPDRFWGQRSLLFNRYRELRSPEVNRQADEAGH